MNHSNLKYKQIVKHIVHTYPTTPTPAQIEAQKAAEKAYNQQMIANPQPQAQKQTFVYHANNPGVFKSNQSNNSYNQFQNVHPMVQRDIDYIRRNHLSYNKETNSIHVKANNNSVDVHGKDKDFNRINHVNGSVFTDKHVNKDSKSGDNYSATQNVLNGNTMVDNNSKSGDEDQEMQSKLKSQDVSNAALLEDKRKGNYYFQENQYDYFQNEVDEYMKSKPDGIFALMSQSSFAQHPEKVHEIKSQQMGNFIAWYVHKCDWVDFDTPYTEEQYEEYGDQLQIELGSLIDPVMSKVMVENDVFDQVLVDYLAQNSGSKETSTLVTRYLWCNIYDINDKVYDTFNSYKISKNYQLKYMFYSLVNSELFNKFFLFENLYKKDKSYVYYLYHYYSITSPIFNDNQNEQAFSLNIIKKLNKIADISMNNITYYRNFLYYYLLDYLHDYFNIYLKKKLVFKTHSWTESLYTLQDYVEMYINDYFNAHVSSSNFDLEFININKGYFLIFYYYSYLNADHTNCFFDKTVFLDLFTQAQQVFEYDFNSIANFTLEYLFSYSEKLDHMYDLGGEDHFHHQIKHTYTNNQHLRTLVETYRTCFWYNFNKKLANGDYLNVNKYLTINIKDMDEKRRRLSTYYYIVYINNTARYYFENVKNKNDFIQDSNIVKYMEMIIHEMYDRVNIKNKMLNPLPHNIFFVLINYMNSHATSEKHDIGVYYKDYMRLFLLRHYDNEQFINLIRFIKLHNIWLDAVNNVFFKVEMMLLSVWYSNDHVMLSQLKDHIPFFDEGFKNYFNTNYGGFIKQYENLGDDNISIESFGCLRDDPISMKILILRDKGYNFSCTLEFTNAVVVMYWTEMAKLYDKKLKDNKSYDDPNDLFVEFAQIGQLDYVLHREY